MNGNYQSTCLIHFTTYVSTKNLGGLTIGTHERAVVGLMSPILEFDAYSEGSRLLMSLTFLLHPFFLLPAYAGQNFSYRHKTTCKRHRCSLFMELARLTGLLLDTTAPSTNMATENLHQPGLSQQLLFLISGVLIACIHFTKAGSFLRDIH